jgi:hypothetical protein
VLVIAFEIATVLSALSAVQLCRISGLAAEPTGIPAFKRIAADSPARAWSYPETLTPSALACSAAASAAVPPTPMM